MQFNILTDHSLTDAIKTLINRAYRGTEGAGRWTTEQHLVDGDRIQADAVAAMLGDPQCDVIGAFDNGQLLGCISVRYLAAPLTTIAEIGSFAIEPQAHGQGLGSQLLAFAEQHAVGKRPVLQVEVVNENLPLKAFYERRGYRTNGEIMDYPVQANVGLPKVNNLHLVVLRKSALA